MISKILKSLINIGFYMYIPEKGGFKMAIILITSLLVVVMLGLSFISYISENNLLDEVNLENK